MHPANPRMNITPPTTRKSQTGSKPPRSVMEEMLDRTPYWTEHTTGHWEAGAVFQRQKMTAVVSPRPTPGKNFTGHLIRSHHGKKHYQTDREKKRKREEKLISFQGLEGFIFLVKLYKAKT